MDAQKLKNLQVRKTQLETELKDLQQTVKNINKKICETNNSLINITKEIKNITSQSPTISEHALLRYVERVLGIDLEKIKREILSEKNIAFIEHLKSCKFPISTTHKAVVKNKVVVTIEDS